MLALLSRFYPYVAGIALLLSITVWIWMRGYHACQNEHLADLQKGESAYAKIERKNMGLADTAIDKQLCAHWMRTPCPKRHL